MNTNKKSAQTAGTVKGASTKTLHTNSTMITVKEQDLFSIFNDLDCVVADLENSLNALSLVLDEIDNNLPNTNAPECQNALFIKNFPPYASVIRLTLDSLKRQKNEFDTTITAGFTAIGVEHCD